MKIINIHLWNNYSHITYPLPYNIVWEYFNDEKRKGINLAPIDSGDKQYIIFDNNEMFVTSPYNTHDDEMYNVTKSCNLSVNKDIYVNLKNYSILKKITE